MNERELEHFSEDDRFIGPDLDDLQAQAPKQTHPDCGERCPCYWRGWEDEANHAYVVADFAYDAAREDAAR